MRLAPVKPPITIWFEVILKNSVVIFKRNSGTYRNYFIFYINVLLRRWAQGIKLMVPQWLVCSHTPKMHIPRSQVLNHFLNLKAADRTWTTTACWAIFTSIACLRASGKSTNRQHTGLHSARVQGHTRWHTRGTPGVWLWYLLLTSPTASGKATRRTILTFSTAEGI